MTLVWIFLGMAIATAIPRLLPAWLLEKVRPTPLMREWLEHVPYAVLGALVFPGILQATPEHPWIGLVAGVVAGLLAWRRWHMLVVIIAAVIIVLGFKWWLL